MFLYDFVTIPQSFFVLQKMTAPFTREPVYAHILQFAINLFSAGASPLLCHLYRLLWISDSRKGCPYGMIYISIRALTRTSSLFTITSYLARRALLFLRLLAEE